MVVEESKEADKTTGEATHRISRGINDKVIDYTVDVLLHSLNFRCVLNLRLLVWCIQGHSVTRKLNSSGGVESTQTLHNLDEGLQNLHSLIIS